VLHKESDSGRFFLDPSGFPWETQQLFCARSLSTGSAAFIFFPAARKNPARNPPPSTPSLFNLTRSPCQVKKLPPCVWPSPPPKIKSPLSTMPFFPIVYPRFPLALRKFKSSSPPWLLFLYALQSSTSSRHNPPISEYFFFPLRCSLLSRPSSCSFPLFYPTFLFLIPHSSSALQSSR